jgi:hypothetical protein
MSHCRYLFLRTSHRDHLSSSSFLSGSFRWVTGLEVDTALTFTAWNAGEPNGGTSENCIHGTPVSWNDLSCSALSGYYAEYDYPDIEVPGATGPTRTCLWY